MTEENSTTSHQSVVMTTEGTDATQTTGGNSMTSSFPAGDGLYWEYAVIFIGVVGTAGNALILYALVASKQHKKHVLIVNQNALDLFSSFFLVVTYAVRLCNIQLTGAFGYWLCKAILNENLIWWGTNGSMVNLAIITIDRYLKVVHPIWSRKWLRPWVAYSAAAFSWFVGIAVNMILVFYPSAVIEGLCVSSAMFNNFWANMAIVIAYILFFYLIILVIFIFCYGHILVAIRRQTRVMATHNTVGTAQQIQSNQIQSNVIKTMILVSAFYAIAWLPYNVNFMLIMLTFFDSGAYYATTFIAFFYTGTNPFIYATKFDPVKEILRKMVPWKKVSVQPTDGTAYTTGNRTYDTRTPGHDRK